MLQHFDGNNIRGYVIFPHPSCLSYVEFMHFLMAMWHCNVHKVVLHCDIPQGLCSLVTFLMVRPHFLNFTFFFG